MYANPSTFVDILLLHGSKFAIYIINDEKSAQRPRKHCALAFKNVRLAADTLPRGRGPPKFNQLETVTTFTYRPCLVKIDARSFELSW